MTEKIAEPAPEGPIRRDDPDDNEPEPARRGWVRFLQRPSGIVILTASYLLLAYIAILLVDVMELGDIKAWIGGRFRHGLLWWYIFMEKGPTEFLQYSFLAAVAVLGAVLSGRLRATGQQDASRFWLLIAVAGAVLSLEDATSFRYILTAYVRGFAGNPEGSTIRLLVEGLYYGAIAGIPVYAFLRYWRISWGGPSRWWLITGYAAYGVAAGASVTRYVGFWYMEIGDRIIAASGGRLGEGFTPYSDRDPGAGNWFMDLLVEESIEVMAAALLLAAVLAYAGHHRHQQEMDPEQAGPSIEDSEELPEQQEPQKPPAEDT